MPLNFTKRMIWIRGCALNIFTLVQIGRSYHRSIRRPITVVLYLPGCTCSIEAGITWHCLVMTHSKESLYLQGRSAPRSEKMRVCLSDRIHQSGSIEANRKTLRGLLERVRLWLYALRDLHFFWTLISNLQVVKSNRSSIGVIHHNKNPRNSRKSSMQMQIGPFFPKHII